MIQPAPVCGGPAVSSIGPTGIGGGVDIGSVCRRGGPRGQPVQRRAEPGGVAVATVGTEGCPARNAARVIPRGHHPGMAMTLRLSEEQTAKLRATAEREGISMQAAALKAIDDYISRRTQRRQEIIEQIFTEDASLFDRLSDA